ncbi:hypothetical protein YC2023_069309 [Brassica napus]
MLLSSVNSRAADEVEEVKECHVKKCRRIEEAAEKGELDELVLMIIWKRLDLARRDDAIKSLDRLNRRYPAFAVTEMVRLGIFIFLLFLTLVGETSSSSDLPRVCECEQVQFTPNNIEDDTPQILLPWSPSCQEMQLIVTGGCAKASTDYKWLTSDTSIISVSPYGIMKAKRPGIATVKVVSTIEPQNFDEIFVKVLVPPPMVMWQNVLVQTVVASRLQIGVTMKYSKGKY